MRGRKCLAKCYRCRYSLENKNVDEKICLRVKNRESRQRQSVAAENRAAGLTAQLKELGETESGASRDIPDDADCVCRISGESYECCL